MAAGAVHEPRYIDDGADVDNAPLSIAAYAPTPDAYIQLMYNLHDERGLRAGLATRLSFAAVLPILGLATVVAIGFVDWAALVGCGSSASSCGPATQYISTTLGAARVAFAAVQGAALLTWLLWLLACLPGFIRSHRAADAVYRTYLHMDTSKLHRVTWEHVVDQLSTLHGVRPERAAHFRAAVRNRLCRRTNFWRAIYVHDIPGMDGLALPAWVTDTHVWFTLMDWAVVGDTSTAAFAATGLLPSAAVVRARILVASIVLLACAPCVSPFLLLFNVLQTVESARNMASGSGAGASPGSASSSAAAPTARTFSVRAQWMLRDHGETDGEARRRLSPAAAAAGAYVNATGGNPVLHAVCGSVLLLAACVAGGLLILAAVDERVLTAVTLGPHNLLWYLGVASVVAAVARAGRMAGETSEAVAEAAVVELQRWVPNARQIVDDLPTLCVPKAVLMVRELCALVYVPVYMIMWCGAGPCAAFVARLQAYTTMSTVGYVCVSPRFQV